MEYVWGIAHPVLAREPEFVVLTEESAREVADILRLFAECRTWGELRARATPRQLAEVYDLAGYGDFEAFAAHLLIGQEVPGALEYAADRFEPEEEPPGDDEAFDPYRQIGSVADGDWPPAPWYLMNLEIPGDLIEAHGERYETVFNGTYARFPAAAKDAVLEELQARGHTCTEDADLVFAAFRG